jgi:hypothetical protein
MHRVSRSLVQINAQPIYNPVRPQLNGDRKRNEAIIDAASPIIEMEKAKIISEKTIRHDTQKLVTRADVIAEQYGELVDKSSKETLIPRSF